jgi:hypothetical protein
VHRNCSEGQSHNREAGGKVDSTIIYSLESFLPERLIWTPPVGKSFWFFDKRSSGPCLAAQDRCAQIPDHWPTSHSGLFWNSGVDDRH